MIKLAKTSSEENHISFTADGINEASFSGVGSHKGRTPAFWLSEVLGLRHVFWSSPVVPSFWKAQGFVSRWPVLTASFH